MYFVPFYFEDQNGEPGKLRQIMVLQDGLDLPQDTYVFLENYCINKNCDCRKVMINAISKSNPKILGTFTYGWEELKYYTKWLSGDKELAIELKGPALELGGIQSEYAEILLRKFKGLVEDEQYRERLKEHYQLFKKRLTEIQDEDLCLCGSSKQWKDCCAKLCEKLGTFVEEKYNISDNHKIGRNDPCHCGSGKKYKKCCSSRDEELNNPLDNVSRYPIDECLINKDWKQSGLATIIVIRKHVETGQFSFVSFLVDVFCLGLKNTLFQSEVDEDAVTDFVAMYPQSFTEIEYDDCRGIVLGAIAYAKDLGFEPHGDWEKVKGFIENDKPYKVSHTFGKDGKPFYIEGPNDDVKKIMQILRNNHDGNSQENPL